MKKSKEEFYAAFVGGSPQIVACPNCWGIQEWDMNYQQQPITPNVKPKAFIQKFVDKYLKKKF